MFFSAEIYVGNFRNVIVAVIIAAVIHTINILMIVDVVVVFGASGIEYQRLGAVIRDETCPNAASSVPIGADFEVFFFGIKNIVEKL